MLIHRRDILVRGTKRVELIRWVTFVLRIALHYFLVHLGLKQTIPSNAIAVCWLRAVFAHGPIHIYGLQRCRAL